MMTYPRIVFSHLLSKQTHRGFFLSVLLCMRWVFSMHVAWSWKHLAAAAEGQGARKYIYMTSLNVLLTERESATRWEEQSHEDNLIVTFAWLESRIMSPPPDTHTHTVFVLLRVLKADWDDFPRFTSCNWYQQCAMKLWPVWRCEITCMAFL